MINKIIFLHVSKTGGSTLRRIFDSKLKTLRVNSYVIDHPNFLEMCESSTFIRIHNSQSTITFFERLKDNYESILNNSLILFLSREPLKAFESEWSKYKEIFSFNYPIAPSIDKKKLIDSGGILSTESVKGYSELGIEHQVSVNDWYDYASSVSFDSQILNPSLSESLNHPSFHNLVSRRGGFAYIRNRQTETLRSTFGNDLMTSLVNRNHHGIVKSGGILSMFLATELLDEMMAYILSENQGLRRMTSIEHLSKPLDIYQYFQSNRWNVRETALVEDPSNILNPLNRIKFYNFNRSDYALWSKIMSDNASWLAQNNFNLY